MPDWRTSDSQSAAFSRPARDDEVLRSMDEAKEAESFLRMGIERPQTVAALAEVEAGHRRGPGGGPPPHRLLLRHGRSELGLSRAALVAAQRTGANLLSDPRLGGRRAGIASSG